MRKFYSFCIEHTVIPKFWRRATVVAILKPNKPKSCRPISLRCVPYKILEKLILARINPVIEQPQLRTEQAGFRQGRSTVHQVLKLTCEIEKNFENGYNGGSDSCLRYCLAPGPGPNASTYHSRPPSCAFHHEHFIKPQFQTQNQYWTN